MKRADFRIGQDFTLSDKRWRGTDIGTRVVVAIEATLCRGTAEQKAMAQDALDRWRWPVLMMFGPSDRDSMHSADSTRWRIKYAKIVEWSEEGASAADRAHRHAQHR